MQTEADGLDLQSLILGSNSHCRLYQPFGQLRLAVTTFRNIYPPPIIEAELAIIVARRVVQKEANVNCFILHTVPLTLKLYYWPRALRSPYSLTPDGLNWPYRTRAKPLL